MCTLKLLRTYIIAHYDSFNAISLRYSWSLSHVIPQNSPFDSRNMSGTQRGTTNRDIGNLNVNYFNEEYGIKVRSLPKTGNFRSPRRKWFPSYKEDPGSFITNILIIMVTAYSIFTLTPGESMKVRRQRKLRQILLDKANLTEAELAFIENYDLGGFQKSDDRVKHDK